MAKKGTKVKAAGAVLAGTGVAVLLSRKLREKKEAGADESYRNTELGKNAKNKKGIYYSSGNYEAFARPEKPEGVEEKNAYIVGSGSGLPGGGLFPGKRCPDAGKSYTYSGGAGYCGRRV